MKKFYIFLLFWLTFLSSNVFAEDYYWTGATNSNYNNLNNWRLGSATGGTPTVIPGTNDNVFFTDIATNYNVNFDAHNVVFNNFTSNSTSNNYVFNMTATANALKIITINGVLNLNNKAKFTGPSGTRNTKGTLVINKTPIIDNNDFDVFLNFNKSNELIKISSNFSATSIEVSNGVTLDISGLTVNLKQYDNNTDVGAFIVKGASTGIKFDNATLNVGDVFLEDLDLTKSSFTNSVIYIRDGNFSYNGKNTSANNTRGSLSKGLVVTKAGISLPNVIIENFYNKPTSRSTILAKLGLTINNLEVKNTNVFFDTEKLNVTNLKIDRGNEYYIYGSSSLTSPSAEPNIKVANFNINPSTNGILNLKSFSTDTNKMALIDIPVLSSTVYHNIVANNIYSVKNVTFSNSIIETASKNINVVSGANINYYWGGKGDGKTWEDIANWSSNGTSQVNVSTLPAIFDNVNFNANSVFSNNTINFSKIVDVHDFKVHVGSPTFEINNDYDIPFVVRGSMELQSNASLYIKYIILKPTSTDINNPETIIQNGGAMGTKLTVPRLTGFNYTLMVVGNGVLNIKGPEFNYRAYGSTMATLELVGGTLIFDSPIVNLESFTGSLDTNSPYSMNLLLKNSLIDLYNWKYTNNFSNINDGRFLLDAGTSEIRISAIQKRDSPGLSGGSFSGSNLNLINTPTHPNRLQYNKVIIGYNGLEYSSMALAEGYNIKDLDIRASIAISGRSNGVLANSDGSTIHYNTINNIKIKAGKTINFTNKIRTKFTDTFVVDNSACLLITNLIANSSGNTGERLIIGQNLVDNSGTARKLTLNGFSLENIYFEKDLASYQIDVYGSAINSIGYNSLNSPQGNTFYWIGSTTATNNWDNSVNWTINVDGTPSATTCSPTRFDNAHFKNFSNLKGVTVNVSNNIYINNLIFESDSPQNMNISGLNFNLYAGGNVELNKTSINLKEVRLNGINTNNIRHHLISKNSTFSDNLVLGTNSYYKFVDDIKLTQNRGSLYLENGSDTEMTGITLYARQITDLGNSGKNINFSNSTLFLSLIFNLTNGAVITNANNTKFNLGWSNNSSTGMLDFKYSSSNGSVLNSSFLEFIDTDFDYQIVGNNSSPLIFGEIVSRGVSLLIGTDVSVNKYTSLTNQIRITSGKEFKILNEAHLSGASCNTTRSIVSSIPGTQAYLTIAGGDTNFDYLTLQDINASRSIRTLGFGTYSINRGNNTNMTFSSGSASSTYGFDAVYACRDITTDNILSADGFYPNAFTTFQWYKIVGTTRTLVATSKDINLNQANFGYGDYELIVNYDPSTVGACEITSNITISPTPTSPTELADDKFCKKDVVTFADIELPGYDLVWYDTASSSTPINPTTAIVSGTTYYVARKNQSSAGLVCESTDRLALEVKLDACGGVYLNPVLRLRGL